MNILVFHRSFKYSQFTNRLSEVEGRECDVKIRLMEARHREEMLVNEQKHDGRVKMLLERKKEETQELIREQERICLKKDEDIVGMENKIQQVCLLYK